MRSFSALLLLVFAPLLMAETPTMPNSDLEGGLILRSSPPAVPAKLHIDGLTWSLMAADGSARMLDAFSTQRMLKNACSSGQTRVGVSTCNYEQYLPGFITNHESAIYAFDGAVWLSEFAATRFLIQHRHRRLARLIPFLDSISTMSFAVNNLTLSIGENGGTAPGAAKSNPKRSR